MKMTGEQLIHAPREDVWNALNDPEILRQSIPGCEEIDKQSDTEFSALVVAKVGPVKAKFKGKVSLSDIDAPNSYTITGEGQGGAAGFGKGGAKVFLEDAEDGTLLKYDVDASVGGKLAQIGSRLIDSASRKMADDFFKKFNEVVSAAAVPAAGEEAAPAMAEVPAAAPEKAKGGVSPLLWGTVLILIALALFYLLR